MRFGYARVSTREQNLDHQVDALHGAGCAKLHGAGCAKVFSDKASGKLARRPEWDRVLEQIRAGD